MEQNFDLQFTSDEDIQRLLDGFVDGMQDMVAEEESKATIINPLRLAHIKFAYSTSRSRLWAACPWKARCWSSPALNGSHG